VSPALPSQDAVTALANMLFEEMERLAPSCEGSGWETLDDWERDLHLHGVRRILRERGLVLRALADNDDVAG